MPKNSTFAAVPENIPLDNLHFDPHNPRLPAWVARDEESIHQHIVENYALRELIDSFTDNGYFEAERLLVIKLDDNPGHYIVVEGNRRLAALRELEEQARTAKEVAAISPDLLQDLSVIPCLIVESREEINTYLAYRHIGGMKTWSAEAKARFILNMANELASQGDTNPFRTIGRKIGSNAYGVRNLYTSLAVLEYAREELGLNTEYVQYSRFGVWDKCMNSSAIKEYIGLGDSKLYSEIVRNIESIDNDNLEEVISDLTVRSGGMPAIVNDSRLVTNYGRVLTNEAARQTLRDYEDLHMAVQVLKDEDYAYVINSIDNQISKIIEDIATTKFSEEIALELKTPVQKLYGHVRILHAAVQESIEDDD